MIVQTSPSAIQKSFSALGQQSPHVYTINSSQKPIHVRFTYNQPYTQIIPLNINKDLQKSVEKPLKQSRRKRKIFLYQRKLSCKSVDINKKRRSSIFRRPDEKDIHKSNLTNSHIFFVHNYNLDKSSISGVQTIVDRLVDFDEKQILNPINKKLQNIKNKQKIKRNFHFPRNLFLGNGAFNNQGISFKTSLYSTGIHNEPTDSPIYSPRNRIQSEVFNIMCTPQRNRSVSAHYLSKYSHPNNQMIKESIIISRQVGNSGQMKSSPAILDKKSAITQRNPIISNSTIIVPHTQLINHQDFHKNYNSKSNIHYTPYHSALINYQTPQTLPNEPGSIQFQPIFIKTIRPNIFREEEEVINNSFKNINSCGDHVNQYRCSIAKSNNRTSKISNIIVPNTSSTINQEIQGSLTRFFDQSSLQTPRLPNVLLKTPSFQIADPLSSSLRKEKQQLKQEKRKKSLSMRLTQEEQEYDQGNLMNSQSNLNKRIQTQPQLHHPSSLTRLVFSTAQFYIDKKQSFKQRYGRVRSWFDKQRLMMILLIILGLSVMWLQLTGIQENQY